jgi:hypothetical protein
VHVKRLHAELGLAALTALAGALTAYGSLELGASWTDHGPEPGYFPYYVGLLLLGASIWNGAKALRRHRPAEEEPFLVGEQSQRLARFLLPMAAFVVVTVFLGLYVGSALYLFWIAWRQGGYRPYLAALLGLAFSLFLYIVFEIAFQVPLLKGPLEPLLGIY